MKIAIIKYNAGNIRSVLYALERIDHTAVVTDNADEIINADKVIFPGVGEASTAMKYLKERNLDSLICALTQPVLGICLGMQLMCKYSEENDTECLGIFDENVKKFKVKSE
ncbi:MAG TPA: imidazole glycerol phosphate synthase subunit HisH, partial [Chitinophagaceae bacterium]|nr:imidazole glycerol phosphate synthase subunit HisH [Chitinophagaceae bacterium]